MEIHKLKEFADFQHARRGQDEISTTRFDAVRHANDELCMDCGHEKRYHVAGICILCKDKAEHLSGPAMRLMGSSQNQFHEFKSSSEYCETYTRRKTMDKATLAKKALDRARDLKAGKNGKSTTTAKTTKAANVKKSNRKPRGEGKYDRNEIFTCEVKGCVDKDGKQKTITGPWSYKQHLIKVHGYSPEKAGLTPRAAKKGKK